LRVIREADNNENIAAARGIFLTTGILTLLLLAGTFVLVFYYFKKRQKTEKELMASELKFRLLLHSIKDLAIFMIDANGNILNWNEGASKIKGYKEGEIIGQSVSIFYTEEAIARGEPWQNLQAAALSGSYETAGWRVRKDGSLFWGDVLITAIYDEQKNVTGFTKVTRDFTLHKETEDDVNRLLKKKS
jgi:PAS domain S-box-containing protein